MKRLKRIDYQTPSMFKGVQSAHDALVLLQNTFSISLKVFIHDKVDLQAGTARRGDIS